jgi:hypothetical protein
MLGMDRLRPIVVIVGMRLWGTVAHIYRLARSRQLTARRGGPMRRGYWGPYDDRPQMGPVVNARLCGELCDLAQLLGLGEACQLLQ